MNQAKRIAIQQLKSLQQSGLQVMPKPPGNQNFDLRPAATPPTSNQENLATPRQDTPVSPNNKPHPAPGSPSNPAAKTQEAKPSYLLQPELTDYESEPLSLDQRQSKLEILNQQVTACTACKELSACRTSTVFGVGNVQTELCFLGEGPGADEDRQGEPFVGQAGQLLNKIIEACKMSRDDVYILNTVKCRPPGNRNPNEDELNNCWPYAIQQLEILQPKFICCLGSIAAKTLLNTKQSIGRMRGQFFQFRGSQVVVTYHPAYLLRNPSAKRQVWDDMKMLLAKMGREI